MHLADEEMTLRLGEERLHLRPTLRAAARLERRHGGFNAVFEAIGEANVTVIADVIQECSGTSTDVLAVLIGPGMSQRVLPLLVPLQAFVLDLMGFDPDAEEKTKGGPRITFAEVHARLYGIATGWLGWSPANAWDATPREIRAAQEGRLDLLKAVFGDPEKGEGKGKAGSVDDRFAALIQRNQALAATFPEAA